MLDAYEFVQPLSRARRPPSRSGPARLVTGEDLKEMGFSPGPEFKAILRAVEEAQLEGQLQSREQALEFVRGSTCRSWVSHRQGLSTITGIRPAMARSCGPSMRTGS